MATIKDVAAAAGVKPATVSYALNGTGSVSPTTRARVLRIAQELQYQPSHTARALQGRRSDALGVVVSDRRDPMTWGIIVNGIVDAASTAGYDLLLRTTDDSNVARSLSELAASRRVGGIVVIGFETGSDDPELAIDLPLVTTSSVMGQALIGIDNVAGTLEAIAHLVVLGCSRIAFVAPPVEWSLTDQQEAGYRAALAEAGIEFDPALFLAGDASDEAGYLAALELLQGESRPDAIVAGLASLAFGTLQAVNEHGLRVGRDVAVLACDEPRAAAYMAPPLTALRQPYYDLGRELAEHLVRRIRGEPAPATVLYPQLIVRRSCGE